MHSFFARVTLICALAFFLSTVGANGQYRRRPNSGTSGLPGAQNDPAATMHGVVKRIKGKELLMTTDQNQDVTIYLTRKTKFVSNDGRGIKGSSIAPGSVVSVDVSKAPDLSSLAVNVRVEAPPV